VEFFTNFLLGMLYYFTVHEGTLVEVIDLISSWGGFLDSDFPPELSNYLKKVLPNSKGALRTSLGRLFSSIFGTETRAKPAKATFKDILIQSFERSYAQVTQVDNTKYFVEIVFHVFV